MTQGASGLVQDAPLQDLTFQVIGVAMRVHSALGPGHGEAAYHNAMLIALNQAGLSVETAPFIPIDTGDGTYIRGAAPDLLIADKLIVELKAHTYTMTAWEQAQVLSYFAALPQCPVALYLNFGHSRLEYRRLFPTRDMQVHQSERRTQAK